jgi:hypothetical protein
MWNHCKNIPRGSMAMSYLVNKTIVINMEGELIADDLLNKIDE